MSSHSIDTSQILVDHTMEQNLHSPLETTGNERLNTPMFAIERLLVSFTR